jgi:hypothetical protein
MQSLTRPVPARPSSTGIGNRPESAGETLRIDFSNSEFAISNSDFGISSSEFENRNSEFQVRIPELKSDCEPQDIIDPPLAEPV